jgi:hypothetical protein
MQFTKDYEIHPIPPGDQLLSTEELQHEGFEIDDARVLNFLNDKMEQGSTRKRPRPGCRRRAG